MSGFYHTVVLLLAIVGAYFWLQIPGLNQFSLQVFVACIAAYLILKRVSKTTFWHLAPATLSVELALVTFSFLLLIGFTGNTSSLFYPLGYVHLFFVAFASRPATSFVTILGVMFFHYALLSSVTPNDVSLLLTLPVMWFFFIFAKAQYQQATREQSIIDQDEQLIVRYNDCHQQLFSFIHSFVGPKLQFLSQLLEHPVENKQTVLSQITLLQVEIEKVMKRLPAPELSSQAQRDTFSDQEDHA